MDLSFPKVSLSTFTTTETLICSGWKIPIVLISQPETPDRDKRGCPDFFVPGLATRTKSTLLSWLVHQPGQKVLPAPHAWRTLLSLSVLPTGTKCPFFSVPLFSIVFRFRLYFYISIKLMYWNSVCKISTNIYIYIVTYIIFVLDSFHI